MGVEGLNFFLLVTHFIITKKIMESGGRVGSGENFIIHIPPVGFFSVSIPPIQYFNLASFYP